MNIALRIFAMTFVLLLAACGSAPKKAPTPSQPSTTKPSYYSDDGPPENIPVNLAEIPDAVPKDEPFHRGASRPYTVFGRTYVPQVNNDPFKQTGVASWYGRKFHGQKTAIGESYDMFSMSAAHPTLPLPSYARVTNIASGKSVVVRVNDRGPFLHDRIIDLSYAAAHRIGIAGPGSGRVSVERIFAGDAPVQVATVSPVVTPTPPIVQTPPTPITSEPQGVYIQLGAFGSAENAAGFRERMQRDLNWMREPIAVAFKDGLHRVRIGPLSNRDEAEAIAAKVRETHDLTPVLTRP